jgi:RNA-directed DNA polymerase
MTEERRGRGVRKIDLTNLDRRDELEKSTKSFAITKRMVYEAWKRVKANRGAAGIDDETIAKFEGNLGGNLYKLWNRLSSGSYFPPPVKEVEIPKRSGGVRVLGVPTVADRIAQAVVRERLEPLLEPHFDPDSYGYRPGRSAKDAVRVTRERCWKYSWVLEFDIKGAFDNLNHDLMMKAVRKHANCRWVELYVERWLKAPSMTNAGELRARDRGTPQGGVISPLLMNLFMHYAFDSWLRKADPSAVFARYADDAVVHCLSEKHALRLKSLIAERLAACGLELHAGKTRIVYCRDSNRRQSYPITQFTFLGFTFRARGARAPSGGFFSSFLPAVSRDAAKRMRQQIRSWRLPLRSPATIADLSASCDSIMTGWWNYYGSFYGSAMGTIYEHFDRALAFWVRRKFKPLARHRARSFRWVSDMASREPHHFIHWRLGYAYGTNNGSRVIREDHARFCERPRGKFPRPTHEAPNA